MNTLLIGLSLTGKKALIVGGGELALRKKILFASQNYRASHRCRAYRIREVPRVGRERNDNFGPEGVSIRLP
jgi:hypothetical protein